MARSTTSSRTRDLPAPETEAPAAEAPAAEAPAAEAPAAEAPAAEAPAAEAPAAEAVTFHVPGVDPSNVLKIKVKTTGEFMLLDPWTGAAISNSEDGTEVVKTQFIVTELETGRLVEA